MAKNTVGLHSVQSDHETNPSTKIRCRKLVGTDKSEKGEKKTTLVLKIPRLGVLHKFDISIVERHGIYLTLAHKEE